MQYDALRSKKIVKQNEMIRWLVNKCMISITILVLMDASASVFVCSYNQAKSVGK